MQLQKWIVVFIPLVVFSEEVSESKVTPAFNEKRVTSQATRDALPWLMESVSQDGAIIRLHDGRRYSVMPADRWISQGWMTPGYPGPDPRPISVFIKENPDKSTQELREYPYIIVNPSAQEWVYAKVWVAKIHRKAMSGEPSSYDQEEEGADAL